MSVLVSLSVKAKPENREELKSWFKDEVDHTRDFEGCRGISIHVDQDNPNHLFVLGKWDSRQDHENYLSWRSAKGDVEKIAGWLDSEIVSNYLDSVDM